MKLQQANMNVTPVKSLNAFQTPTKTPTTGMLSGNLEIQVNLGDWRRVRVELCPTGLKLEGGEESSMLHFREDTRISIPMRNLKREAQFKGCAFQVESGDGVKTFMAPSLAEKNVWARKLNIALGELRKTGNYVTEGDEENAPITPAFEKATYSVDRKMKQKFAVQQLAQSLQPRRTMSRTEPSIDRTDEIRTLEEEIQRRESDLQQKDQMLQDALQKLQREQQYREQITSGVEKWRQETNRQKDQKLQDTRERLQETTEQNKTLEAEKKAMQQKEQESQARIEELEAEVREMQNAVDEAHGLKEEIAQLRTRLEKEIAFVQVLEHDTQQMAEELMKLSHEHKDLKERHENEVESYRGQCDELRQQLRFKEEENLQMKEEMGQLRMENKRLQDAQSKMHREFFFSLALSIKLSLAQQGVYSNADLNQLYEEVLSEPYGMWTKAIESKLIASQMNVPEKAPCKSPGTPSKKKGLFGLF